MNFDKIISLLTYFIKRSTLKTNDGLFNQDFNNSILNS